MAEFRGEGKLFSISSKKILIYLKQNSFNFEYSYTFDGVPAWLNSSTNLTKPPGFLK
jgi:hypothetical protein